MEDNSQFYIEYMYNMVSEMLTEDNRRIKYLNRNKVLELQDKYQKLKEMLKKEIKELERSKKHYHLISKEHYYLTTLNEALGELRPATNTNPGNSNWDIAFYSSIDYLKRYINKNKQKNIKMEIFIGYFCPKCNWIVTNLNDTSCVRWQRGREDVASIPIHHCGTQLLPKFENSIDKKLD